MTPVHRWQLGQALTEALLVLPVLILAFLGVAWLGKLQFTAQKVAQASRKAAMSVAAGAPVAASRTPVALAARDQAVPAAITSGNAGLQAEWFGADLRWVSVTAQSSLAGPRPWDAARIQRRTSVAVGAGHAYGDDDARRRIGAAPTAWGQAAKPSLSLARSVGGLAANVEAPWRRPVISLDWLSPWADVVPAERLGKRRSANR
ncbi:TadE family protein [Achromobacter sp. UMC71]|uniref:TadE family protein n=1 Tax=Achromobacter sp. UMC71 TaxID=1862320 RepID=UPI001601C669|nr:TadE family protein [Achromobacter sp. UMC71]MBB1624946.1 hypothetical protein [Achromobacter sp. UMC71]